MSDISDSSCTSGSCSSTTSDPELDVEEFDAILNLGGVVSTLGDNGFWHHKFPRKNPGMQKLSNARSKMQRLVAENQKLRLKFDILAKLAKSTSTQFEETEKELLQLRKIEKQTKIVTKSKKRTRFAKEV